MEFSFDIEDIEGRAFGLCSLSDFAKIAKGELIPDVSAVNQKPQKVPMMTARRLSQGCRQAVDIGMLLSQRQDIDAVIYSSMSGEIVHNHNVLVSSAKNEPCSPTDFSMSVHNTAVGNFTIISKSKIPSSSISSGMDSFFMAVLDAYTMIECGEASKVLVVDYNVDIPEFFKNFLPDNFPCYPYAVGVVVTKGSKIKFTGIKKKGKWSEINF
ncbi:MAG: beta-ketoacyl synthase chain length factor [Succinivibrio sp.]